MAVAPRTKSFLFSRDVLETMRNDRSRQDKIVPATPSKDLLTTGDLIRSYPACVATATVTTYHTVNQELEGTISSAKRRDFEIADLVPAYKDGGLTNNPEAGEDLLVRRCVELAAKDVTERPSLYSVWSHLTEASLGNIINGFHAVGEDWPTEDGTDDWPAAAFRMCQKYVNIRQDNGMITQAGVCESHTWIQSVEASADTKHAGSGNEQIPGSPRSDRA